MGTQTAAPPQTEWREYFSTTKSLTIHPSPGEQVMQNGKLVTFGDIIETFTPAGDYGRLRTKNPVTIQWIENQIAAGRDDIFGSEEYNRRIVPAEVRLAQSQKEERKLQEKNEALEALLEQYKQREAATKGK